MDEIIHLISLHFMRLSYGIALTLGLFTCLSSFMLGLGQNDYMLPILMILAAALSFYLTDYRRIIRLGDWTVNVIVLLIVFCMLGEMLHNRGEDLAFSIARVLVFVEMVLLFREKTPRFCWQILLISLLQVLVASVMQQSLLFAFLLIVYVFVGLCNFVLIFMRQENSYFRNHSFVGTFFDSIRAEIAERQDKGKLARIALITLLTGPLSIVFSFSRSEKKTPRTGSNDADQKIAPKEILRSLFAVFPDEKESNRSGIWETIAHAEPLSTDSANSTNPANLTNSARSEKNTGNAVPQKELIPVPNPASRSRRKQNGVSVRRNRFPLLLEHPGFSGGTMSLSPMEGGARELFGHLVQGTFFALLFAIVLFCLTPRIGRIEFGGLAVKMGHDHWMKPFTQPVGAVGFREEIRLGSLGTVLPYHREVLTARFMKIPDKQIPAPADDAATVPYSEISGASLYFRGIALDTYVDGSWKPRKEVTDLFFNPFWEEEEENSPRMAIASKTFHVLVPGGSVQPEDSPKLFFEEGTDLVRMDLTVQPLDTQVFFAPWPFFCNSMFVNRTSIRPMGSFVGEQRLRRRETSMTIYSTAFKHGTQLAVVPCQERIVLDDLLQVPERGLEALKRLAEKWDRESRLPEEDIIGRASYMEQQFLHSDHFRYKLGGTTRNYRLDPLEDFIGQNPQGHCEYFAGALTMMLRSVGIASRVIVGFKTFAAPSAGSQGTIVRQSDAHAWVDVYLPPESVANRATGSYPGWWSYGGWLRLDPSPSSETTIMQNVSFSLTDLNQWVQKMWGEFVLNMNTTKQAEWIYAPIQEGFHYLVYRVFNIEFWKEMFYEIFLNYKKLLGKGVHWQASDWGYISLHLAILAALFFPAWKIIRRLWRSFRLTSGTKRRRRATIEFYVQMERLLSRIGKERRLEETPLEFVQKSGHTAVTLPVVNAYYRVRFGAAGLTEEELQTVRNSLDQLEKIIAESLLHRRARHTG